MNIDKLDQLVEGVKTSAATFNETPSLYKNGVAFRRATKFLEKYMSNLRKSSKTEFNATKKVKTPKAAPTPTPPPVS
jgi:hypothetical protein